MRILPNTRRVRDPCAWILVEHGGVLLGSKGRVLLPASSKSEVGNSDCFYYFQYLENELCDSDLSKLIEEL